MSWSTESCIGVPLSSVWETITKDQKLSIVPSIAKVFKQIQSTPFPSTPTPYGAFAFLDPTSQSSEGKTTESCFYYGGPYSSDKELYKNYMTTQFNAMRKVHHVNGWKGYGEVKLRSGEVLDLGEALNRFEKVVNGEDEGWEGLVGGMTESKPVFIHGDFGEP